MNLAPLIKKLGPDKVRINPEELFVYSYDSSKRSSLPSAVIMAQNEDDVVITVQFCCSNGIPVVSRGAGTGMTGGSVPPVGSIVLSFERMDRIIDFDSENKVAITEPGVINRDLQEFLADFGLYCACDPGSSENSTIGGNYAENACGMRGRRFGSAISNIEGIEFLNSRGKKIKTGYFNSGKEKKLESLIIGSEGTLGIITRLALKTNTVLSDIKTKLIFYSDRKKVMELVREITEKGIVPLSMEFIDNSIYKYLVEDEETKKFKVEGASAVVLLEYSDIDGKTAASGIEAAIKNSIPSHIMTADNPSDRASFWKLRKSISPLLYTVADFKLNEDIAVPLSRMDELFRGIDKLASSSGLEIPFFGHIAVGCMHTNIMYNKEKEKEAHKTMEELFRLVLSLDGTLSAEHGIGITKRAFIPEELSYDEINIMRNIKLKMDPENILNPGKKFSYVHR